MSSISIKPFSSAYANLKFLTPHTNYFTSKNQTNKNKDPRRISFYLSCKLPFDPTNRFSNFNSSLPLNPFSILTSVLRTIKSFATKATAINISGDQTVDYLTTSNGTVLQNGGIGVALLSVTTAANVRISPFVATLAANPTFLSGLLAWFLAQSSKVILNFVMERKWDLRIWFASGGMPSSHSALCTALTTSVAICHGAADSLFPVCLGFSLIVMYDAIGVRRHAGMQAEVLNKIIEDLFQGHPISERKLKELLGHTPSQVFAGALLGILVACFCCQGYWVAV